MADEPEPKGPTAEPEFSREVAAQAARKRKARRTPAPGVWFGLGMTGLVGWSVAIPTLLGTALGLWLDRRHPGTHSWTLALMVAGLVLGSFNAWRWVAKEADAINGGTDGTDE
ncbi:AtpZ/AtpI family protein [Frigoriglobus tundricola]|uniref:Sodium-transporting ATPase subunit Q n=1 Tax=Frigoriglobus tundricola TaxID=2774151 RepID=A0A6M5YVA2_9BACT|nr:AtpZ/AtpI family protein [Frigoriglobus tundricola]QJW97221.1 Sodium-transporting ATPase subunit Q [Frigoriglobus tundricola]